MSIIEDEDKLHKFLEQYAMGDQDASGDHLKIDELVNGGCYAVDGRNYNVAVWLNGSFYGIREKFGSSFVSEEMHYDADTFYGTVRPLKLLAMYNTTT
jgi:hypothetical protein